MITSKHKRIKEIIDRVFIPMNIKQEKKILKEIKKYGWRRCKQDSE